jgi:3-oxoadipate enol-lactonase
MLPKLLDKSTPGRQPAVDEHMRRMILAAPPEGVAAALRGMAARPDVTPDLPTIDTRTLVVVGATDAISPPDEMRSIAAALPNAEFVEVPGVGHMAPLEDPATVNEALLKFLTP